MGTAHPRAGGENPVRLAALDRGSGLSPRGRGKRPGVEGDDGLARLIPARAGKTSAFPAGSGPLPTHPRAGGENEAGDEKGSTFDGSSPRGRGKHDRPREAAANSGLIPARAGKTAPRPTPATSPWAHPRMGGENLVTTVYRLSPGGSSPRGRGKPTREIDFLAARGLIPARAGKTCNACWVRVTLTAHPRAGGENPIGT